MSQEPSGSGDNVGRDKNQQTTNDVSEANLGGGFAGRDYRGDVHNTNHNTQNFYYNQPQEKRDDNQRKLIKYSQETATRLLSQSLRNQVYITLNKQVDETKVIPAMQLKSGNQKVESLPSGTSIINVYDRQQDIQGRLLILGNPGSGKSTALYKIAETLARRAEKDINHPIPLLFNLSSWTNNYTTIKDWLIDELNVQHGLSNKLAKEYLEKELIIPLLDGLDELRTDRQAACVEAINHFSLPRTWKNPLVVCSRIKEFKLLKTRIGLKGSVILKPLSNQQINDYLQEFNAVTVQQLIQSDIQWRKLARIPLFLDIMVLANNKLTKASQQSLNTQKEKIFYLMEIYLRERLEDVGYWQSIYQSKISNSPKRRQKRLKSYLQYVKQPEQTLHYLQWLAVRLERRKKTFFMIETLQSSYLINQKQRRIYRLTFRLIFGLIAGILGVLIWLVPLTIEGQEQLQILLLLPFVSYFLKGTNEAEIVSYHHIYVVETLDLQFILAHIKFGLIFGLIVGLILGLIFGLIFGLISGLIRGLIFGLIFGLIIGLIMGLEGGALQTKTKPNQGIRSLVYNMILTIGWLIILGGGLYFSLWLMSGWLNQIDEELFEYSICMLCFMLPYLFIHSSINQAVLKHFSLRLVLTINNYTPWNYARFLDYCTEQSLLQRVGGGYRFIHRLLQEHLLNE